MISKISLLGNKLKATAFKRFLILVLLAALHHPLQAQGPDVPPGGPGGELDNPNEGGGPGGDLGGDPDLVPISGLEYLLAGAVMYGARKAYKQKKQKDS